MEQAASIGCPPVGDLVRIAEEGGELNMDLCGCQRCVTALVDAVANANFALRIHGVGPRVLTSDAVPNVRLKLNPPLAKGGQGSVYFGVDPQTADCVAVKVLKRACCDNPVHIARVFYEAVWLRQLATAGLVEFHSCGVTTTGKPYLCTKYIEGPTLSQMLADKSLAKLRSSDRMLWALRVTAGILRPLQSLHRRGIVHCDLKPSNILMRRGEEPVLLDLGIAAAAGVDSDHSVPLVFSGSRPYSAPERIRLGDTASNPVVDVFSLGIMLDELAFDRSPAVATPARHTSLVRAIVAKATDSEPRERFADASEMLAAVQAALLTIERLTLGSPRLRVAIGVLAGAALLVTSAGALGLFSLRAPQLSGPQRADDAARGTPLPAFTPRDVLTTLRANCLKSSKPAPDFAAAIHGIDDAKLYFGAISPLREWGYAGGETVGGQILSVAADPVEILYRDGRSKLALLQPLTGVTRRLDRPELSFPRVAISPGGKWILLYGMGREFEIVDRASLATVEKGTQDFAASSIIAIADDGKHIAQLDSSGNVRLRGTDGRWFVPFTTSSPDSTCAFSGDRLIVVTRTGEAMSFDLTTHNLVYRQVAHPPCPAFRLSSRGNAAVVTLMSAHTFGSVDGGLSWTELSEFVQARDGIAIQESPFAVMTFSQGVGRALDAGESPAVQSGFSRVIFAALTDTRQVLVTHGRTWRLLERAQRVPWQPVSGDIPSEMFSQRVSDARIFAGQLGVWRVPTETARMMCLWGTSTSNAALDEAQDDLFVSGYQGNVAMLSATTGELQWEYQREEMGTPVLGMRNGVAVIGGNDSTVTALDADTGAVRWVRQDHRYRVRGVSIAAGRICSASSSPGIVTYDTNGTRQSVCRFIDARCVALAPDGSRFLAGSDRGTVMTAAANSSGPETELPAHDGGVWSVATNPTGTLAASGGGDGIVRLWWLNPLTPLATFAIAPERSTVIFDLRFSDDSRKLSCTIMSQGAYEIDLTQHEHTLEDWLTRDRANSPGGPGSHLDSNDANAEDQ